MSTGQLARQRSSSSGQRPAVRSTTPASHHGTANADFTFEPCAATASIFLFAQGNSVLCLHHDTLALERRFEKHKDRIVLVSVDNVSERGSGRLVVSYDAGQNAIVWDLFTGDEIARFASYEQIKVAAWMKNGNVAFGIMPFEGHDWRLLLNPHRKYPRQCYSIRTLYFGAHLCADNLRSDHSIGACVRLSNLCHWVGQFTCEAENCYADKRADI